MRFALVFAVLAGCAATEVAGESVSEVTVDEAQRPATLTTAGIEHWLDAVFYETWACSEIRPSRPPGGTTPMRVCSNHLASTHGAGEYPIGSVAVRELYDASHTRITGRAVIVKTKAGGGEAWYWYERRDGTLNASAMGDASQAKPCVQCHQRANASLFGHDLVFNQVAEPPPSAEDQGPMGPDGGPSALRDGEGD